MRRRAFLRLAAIASAPLVTTTRGAAQQDDAPGLFRYSSTVVAGTEAPADSSLASLMAPVIVHPDTQGGPDLVVTLLGVDRADRRAGPLLVTTAVHFGDLRLGFAWTPTANYIQELRYSINIKYRYLVKIYYQATPDAPIAEGTTPPLEGTIRGTVIRESSGLLYTSMTNEQTSPEGGVVPFRLVHGGAQMLIALMPVDPPGYGAQKPFPFSEYDNRGSFTAQIGPGPAPQKQP
jgi:hypothetical protein